MSVNFSNTNSVWASVLAETLYRLGLTTAVICPGSRSTPLAIAFAQHPQIEALPILDERSASFFALGLARRSGLPVALVCTSGTAGANFYPAVIEARESRVPLLVLTADRPPELRHCNAGQTIDQQKLFGSFPNWYAELALPDLDLDLLAYLRQTLIHSWERSLHPVPGPVHLNLPLRDPLAPVPTAAAAEFAQQFSEERFFQSVLPVTGFPVASVTDERLAGAIATWQQTQRGVIIAGPAQPRSPASYCKAVAQLGERLGWVVLAEGLSPLRNYADLNPHLIATYDTLLRQPELMQSLAPTQVIRLGEMPTSKELRTWLQRLQPQQWVIEGGDRNLDPLHGQTTHLQTTLEQVVQALDAPTEPNSYSELWRTADAKLRYQIDQTFLEMTDLFEGKAAWLLPRCLPAGTAVAIANSMPVRDVESFWMTNASQIQPYFNRGANGIDGTLSTALGVAHHQAAVLLTGDLALLHDTNGFLVGQKLQGHLTIVLINNNGGGIFEGLAIARFDPPFEEFFATPQSVDFAQLCQTYGVSHERITCWERLEECLEVLPTTGIRVLEIPTNRKVDTRWRQQHLTQLAQQTLGPLGDLLRN